MTALVWDEVGERFFEVGVDRGVLYPPAGAAVPWNGLTQVSENLSREIKSFYIDGVKYLDYLVPGSYSGKIQAFTYPQELEGLVSAREFAPGVFVHDQRAKAFGLCYRTLIGNDLEAEDHGYKIHILYNITASPVDTSHGTLADKTATPQPFEWSLSGVPTTAGGVYPTSHISLDTREIDEGQLATIENLLYGTAGSAPSLPTMAALFDIVT